MLKTASSTQCLQCLQCFTVSALNSCSSPLDVISVLIGVVTWNTVMNWIMFVGFPGQLGGKVALCQLLHIVSCSSGKLGLRFGGCGCLSD